VQRPARERPEHEQIKRARQQVGRLLHTVPPIDR
jgi:hypothetical protein